ncbi:MAG: Uncharacterised protein [Cyanobium sp. ARS6]|nr:MAG: Uncharacterised protein [Cyanobium sp. ARS6]
MRGGAVELLPLQPQHRSSGNGTITFLLQPGIQTAGTETEAAVACERGRVDGLTVEQVHPIHRGASAGKKRRHMQRGMHRTKAISKLLSQHSGFQHPMATQGGITPADQQ